MSGGAPRRGGLLAIILLKSAKALLFAACGAALLFYRRDPAAKMLLRAADWADGDPRLRVTAGALRALSESFALHFPVVVAACLVGGAALSFEAACLAMGYTWAPWVAIGLTGVWIPAEVFELLRGGSLRMGVIAAVNLAIVVYLYRRRGEFRR